ncbi:MAG: hypothetical protein PF692_03880 [Kiritimatiellae bacterium]|jgi:hypothetical protein|nr:hypothetical protein [Kiritimatiellia bacterium]
MKLKLTIALAVGIAIGILVQTMLPAEPSIADHWQAVREYIAYMRDPSNYKQDTSTGFSFADDPFSVEPHLLALELAGELNHLDIVLPTVPNTRESTKLWMAFCESHPDAIVYALGNPSWVAFKPKGIPPIHLNLWFTDDNEPIIQQLIAELEAMGTKESQQAPAGASSTRASSKR